MKWWTYILLICTNPLSIYLQAYAEEEQMMTHHCRSKKTTCEVIGGGTMFSPNEISKGFSSTVTLLHIIGSDHSLKKGSFSISSEAAGPVDPITGIGFEAVGTIDAIRVFESHPEVIWCHGVTNSGSISFGTSPLYSPYEGSVIPLNPINGEFIGAVTSWGRTNFLTVFENGGAPLPNFFNATEGELCSLVGGWSRVLTPLGAKPNSIKTKSPTPPITLTME